MITLSPIHPNIQNTMHQKMRMLKKMSGEEGEYIIGTPLSTSEGDVEKNYMMARVPFLRMTSFTPKGVGNKTDGKDKEAVVLMGGHLLGGTEDFPMNRLKAGFRDSPVDVGSSVTGNAKDPFINYLGMYNQPDGTIIDDIPFRPMAGVKDISIQFQGGGMRLGATRTAEISWNCWTWQELENYRPHFLQHGKTILLEWGWSGDGINWKGGSPFYDIFDGNTLNISETKINKLNQKLVEHTLDQKGQYDAMLGLVQDFSWTVTEDGGFDCSTKIISQGITLLQKIQKRNKTANISVLPLLANEEYNSGGWLWGIDDTKTVFKGPTDVAGYSPYISIKEYMNDFPMQIMKYMDSIAAPDVLQNRGSQYAYMKEQPGPTNNSEHHTAIHNMKLFRIGNHAGGRSFGKALQENTVESKKDGKRVIGSEAEVTKCFVSWGWFEDNVLSRFFGSVTQKEGENVLIGEFRSIQPVMDDNGILYKKSEKDKEDGIYNGAVVGEQVYESTKFRNSRYLVTADSAKWIIPNPNDPFMVSSWTLFRRDIKFGAVNPIGTGAPPVAIDMKTLKDNLLSSEIQGDDGARIRNVYFNANYLKEKFKDSGDIVESVMSVWQEFSSTYGGVYKFKIDFADDGKRAMIVEEGYTSRSVKDSITDDLFKAKVFEFPTFKSDSIVKSQNISAKVPKRMQLAAMYGAVTKNKEETKTEPIEPSEYEDLIAKAWGRFVESLPKNTEGKSPEQLKQMRYDDMLNGRIDFPSRKNRWFGHTKANVNEELTVGGYDTEKGANDSIIEKGAVKPTARDSGIQIMDSIMNELKQSQVDEMYRQVKIAKGYEDDKAVTDAAYEEDLKKVLSADESQKKFFATMSALASHTAHGPGIAGLFDIFYDETTTNGLPKLKPSLKFQMQMLLQGHSDGVLKATDPLIPIEFEVEIDGIGGIHPGNSFHSSYLPVRYKEESLFQAVGVSHKVDSGGWITTIKGQIRATALKDEPTKEKLWKDYNEMTDEEKEQYLAGQIDTTQQSLQRNMDDLFSGKTPMLLHNPELAEKLGIKYDVPRGFETDGGLVKYIENNGIPDYETILAKCDGNHEAALAIQTWMKNSGLISGGQLGELSHASIWPAPWYGTDFIFGTTSPFPDGWLDSYNQNISWSQSQGGGGELWAVLGEWNNWSDPALAGAITWTSNEASRAQMYINRGWAPDDTLNMNAYNALSGN